ncbi:MAG: hypothetical protein NC489_42500 [Ruminococcus flavefaciens]|nr:hypothetical protein [Ruminococcus flavefaciens]
MKVKDCEKCEYCERRTGSDYYKPINYHAIGMSHAYAYCNKHKMRVLEVRGCKELKDGGEND